MAIEKMDSRDKFPVHLIYDPTGGVYDTTELAAAPSTAPVDDLKAVPAAGNLSNGVYQYKVTFVTIGGETTPGPASGGVTVVDNTINGQVELSAIPTGSSGVTARKVYRTLVGGSVFKLLTTIADNTTTTYLDNIADAGLGANAPTVNTAAGSVSLTARAPFVVQVNAIPVGTSAVFEMRVDTSAEWMTYPSLVLDSTNTPFVGNFGGVRVNYVRVKRTGSGVFKAWAQL